MARELSHLVCKCGRRGGFITKRKAGYRKRHSYYYVGHYDSGKGRIWCHLSNHDLAHISFHYQEYYTQYKPLVEKIRNSIRLHEPKEMREEIVTDAGLLLFRMHKGLSAEIAITKVWSDVEELIMLEKIKEADGVGLTTDHNVLSRSLRGLPVTPQRLWCNNPHYKNWAKRKSRTYKPRPTSPIQHPSLSRNQKSQSQ